MGEDELSASGLDLLNLFDFEEAARAVLPAMYYDYVARGAADDVTLDGNRAAFSRWRLLPRIMTGVSEVSLATTVLGQPVSMPVLVAPMGYHRIVHDDGEQATAHAAMEAGTIFTLSTVSTFSIEEIAPNVRHWWFQLYILEDRELSLDLIRRAEASNASAIVVTVDAPVLGRREYNVRNRFALAEGVVMANFRDPEQRVMRAEAAASGLSRVASVDFETALRWSDLEWVCSSTRLPVVLKGVLAPEDARLAFDHGATAVAVSNHGGRQLDSAVASLDALPRVVEAVNGRGEVLMDGGIRRGTDVLKALALGARAVFLGRPLLWGLAVGGESGVRRVLEMIRDEIALDLRLCGIPEVEKVDGSLVVAI